MTFKKLIIVLSITVTIMFTLLLGTSYAWYTLSDAVTSFSNVQTFTDNVDLAAVFTNDNNINTNVGVPIASSDVAELSEKVNFTMTPVSSVLGNRDVAWKVSLVNLNIDSVLTTVSDLKYELLQTVNNVTTTVATGDFYNFSGDSKEITSMITPSNMDVTYYYEFRLWLQDSGSNQNALMNKHLYGKINVDTVFR